MFTATGMRVWKGAPFALITLLAALQTIPREMYEAAEVDGAGPIRKFISITFPMIRGVFLTTALMTTIWAVVTFDRATTKEQREALGEIVAHLFPVKWKSLTTAEGNIEFNVGKDGASARLDGGKTAEVQLKRFEGMNKGPVVIRNLPYFGADSNDGFIVMPNVVEALRAGDKAFEFRGTNGFVTTVSIESKSTAAAPAGY
jgi:hypothetical protein